MALEKIATRDAYGKALVELGSENPNVIVLDADLAGATKTANFKNAYPERFFDCGIAEANMVGIAAGLAATGKIPFVSSFAMFAAGRAFEQIRNSVAYPHLNVKICATHAGISVGEDGATHQCNEDIALMRAIPGMVVLNPADAAETRAAIRAACAYDGPVYVRLGRLAVPAFNDENCEFEIGKGVQLRDGTDVTLVATGLMVARALEAAELLAAQGIDARVLNIHTLKPFDKEIVLKAAKETGALITCEEHSIIGGLYSAVCETLGSEGAPAKVAAVAIEDVFGQSGPAEELLEHYGLTAANIALKAAALLK